VLASPWGTKRRRVHLQVRQPLLPFDPQNAQGNADLSRRRKLTVAFQSRDGKATGRACPSPIWVRCACAHTGRRRHGLRTRGQPAECYAANSGDARLFRFFLPAARGNTLRHIACAGAEEGETSATRFMQVSCAPSRSKARSMRPFRQIPMALDRSMFTLFGLDRQVAGSRSAKASSRRSATTRALSRRPGPGVFPALPIRAASLRDHGWHTNAPTTARVLQHPASGRRRRPPNPDMPRAFSQLAGLASTPACARHRGDQKKDGGINR